MSLLKHIDRLAVLSILSVYLGIPVAAFASTTGNEPSSQVVTRAAPTDANFRSIKEGMTSADVLARIGPPLRKMRFNATKTTSWDYRITDAWESDSEFSVILDDNGIVLSKLVIRLGQ